ncbi:MAG: hypothetical protein V4568_19255 [Pseudomonadota bacterium]
MPAKETTALSQEWKILQNNYEQYEKSALLIKLTGIVICAVGVALALHEMLVSAIVLVLWVQEGIFRTYQSRLGERILCVERLIKQNTEEDGAAFQFHSTWLAARPGVVGLIAEYAKSAMRPTVAYPYMVLLLVNFAL